MLPPYEATNAVLQAVRCGRATAESSEEILVAIEGLDVKTRSVIWQQMFRMARRFDRSVYPAAYLALAEARGESLVTGDRRLYSAVREDLGWVQWIRDS